MPEYACLADLVGGEEKPAPSMDRPAQALVHGRPHAVTAVLERTAVCMAAGADVAKLVPHRDVLVDVATVHYAPKGGDPGWSSGPGRYFNRGGRGESGFGRGSTGAAGHTRTAGACLCAGLGEADACMRQAPLGLVPHPGDHTKTLMCKRFAEELRLRREQAAQRPAPAAPGPAAAPPPVRPVRPAVPEDRPRRRPAPTGVTAASQAQPAREDAKGNQRAPEAAMAEGDRPPASPRPDPPADCLRDCRPGRLPNPYHALGCPNADPQARRWRPKPEGCLPPCRVGTGRATYHALGCPNRTVERRYQRQAPATASCPACAGDAFARHLDACPHRRGPLPAVPRSHVGSLAAVRDRLRKLEDENARLRAKLERSDSRYAQLVADLMEALGKGDGLFQPTSHPPAVPAGA